MTGLGGGGAGKPEAVHSLCGLRRTITIDRHEPGAVPPEAVESLLVTFDTLAGLAGEAGRAGAARCLHEAAEACADPLRKERLLRAAESVAAGEPCALTPEGLTGAQAAAAQTMTMEQWAGARRGPRAA